MTTIICVAFTMATGDQITHGHPNGQHPGYMCHFVTRKRDTFVTKLYRVMWMLSLLPTLKKYRMLISNSWDVTYNDHCLYVENFPTLPWFSARLLHTKLPQPPSLGRNISLIWLRVGCGARDDFLCVLSKFLQKLLILVGDRLRGGNSKIFQIDYHDCAGVMSHNHAMPKLDRGTPVK